MREWLPTLDPVLLLDLYSSVQGLSIAMIPNGDVGSSFGQCLSDTKTYSCTCARDNGCLPFQGEQRQDFGF